MDFKDITDFIHSNDVNAKPRIEEDYLKYLIYNGRLREVVYNKLMQEFEDPKTIKELSNRIVPINIITKSISKLAKVYKNDPDRKPVDLNPRDHDLINTYERSMEINQYMQYANKMFKLHKHTLLEPYLDINGIPRLRVIPSNCFWLFSDDPINPEKPTKIIKLLDDNIDKLKQRFSVWTNDNHFIIDGKGKIDTLKMDELNNPDGINPYGVLPFVHVNESPDLLYPIRPTDMLSVQIAICLLLSDACLAQKYLSWATLTIIGTDGEQKIHVGPAATIQVPLGPNGEKPEIKYIQPDLNAKEVMDLVDKLVEYLLYTNNLSAGQSIGKELSGSSSSGIAKIVDEAQSTEDKEEQKRYFEVAEKQLWSKIAHDMLPVWVSNGNINPEYSGAFTPDFELAISYKDMKPMLTEREQLDMIILKLNNGLITLKGALAEANPNMGDEELNELLSDIQEEKTSLVNGLQGN